MELDCPQAFYLRAFNHAAVERFKVVQIPQLFRLTHTLAACEPLVAIEAETVVQVVVIATEE